MTTTANTLRFTPARNSDARNSDARNSDGGYIDSGIVDDGCEWGYGGCTGIGALTEDPFDRAVNDRISFTVMCGHCAGVRADEASRPRK